MENKKWGNRLRKLVFKILRYSGLPAFFRASVQKNRVTILLFHNIPVETAEQTFQYLSRKYSLISLARYLGTRPENKATFPKKAAIITFDDGYKQNAGLIQAFKKYKAEPTIFLCASMVDTNRHFWFEENHSPYSFKELKNMPDNNKLEILDRYGFSTEKEYPARQVLNRGEIDMMKEITDFQSHTLTHPCLPNCTAEVAAKEIRESKQILEKEFNLNVYALAYPNGDYSERDIELAKEAGYQCAMTVDFGYNTAATDLFRLKRICVNDTNDLNELIVKASGLWDFVKTLNGHKQATGLKKPVN